MHVCEDGEYADTHHESIADALAEAEWEFGVTQEEWLETSELF